MLDKATMLWAGSGVEWAWFRRCDLEAEAEMQTGGHNTTRTLEGGQLLALVQPPGEKWRIRSFEHSHKIRAADGGPVSGDPVVSALLGERPMMEWLTDMPESWHEMRFDSVEEAVAFVEGEILALSNDGRA